MGPVILLILLAVFIGALSQRLTGMGFALVSGPFLVLLMDPLAGVVLVNLCGIVSSLIVLWRTYREADWKLAGGLIVAATVGTLPGALLAVLMPGAALEVFIGALVVVALTSSLVLNLYAPPIPRNTGTVTATGLVSGVMNASAGVGGPALSALALLSRWEQRSFAATIQPVFAVMGVSSVVGKLVFDQDAWPVLDGATWALLLAALVGGQVLGEWLSRITPVQAARTGMLALAFLGGLLTIGRGLGWL
ncbi:MAG TPA: sulfite exporter TauE/SafE family protein [Brevibacterium sp.]|nr:sulfite exporter TauE/SafE family protein [Brevibacterium sp.]